jgi:hypothetical protein
VKRLDPGRVRLDFAQLAGIQPPEAGDPVLAAPPLQLVEAT